MNSDVTSGVEGGGSTSRDVTEKLANLRSRLAASQAMQNNGGGYKDRIREIEKQIAALEDGNE